MENTRHNVPGPPTFSVLLNLGKDLHSYLYELMQQYGDLVRIKAVVEVFVVNHPFIARDIFMQVNKTVDKKTFVNERMKRVFGDGVVVSDGATWMESRRLIYPAFGKTKVHDYAHIVESETCTMLDRWSAAAKTQTILQLGREFKMLMIDIMSRIVFSDTHQDESDLIYDAMETGALALSHSLPFELPRWIPLRSERQLDSVITRIRTLFRQKVELRKTVQGDWPDDLLSILIRHNESHPLFSEAQLLDELINLFFAGIFTTSDCMTWTMYLLEKHPRYLEQVVQEIGLKIASGKLSFEEAADLQYLNAAICESLRLYPPVWSAWYHTQEAIQAGGFHIPKDATVVIDLFNVHRHAGFFEAPHTFLPARHLSAEKTLTPVFTPFGLGPRKCIGANLAAAAMPLVLALILRDFRVSAHLPWQAKPAVKVTLTQSIPFTFVPQIWQ